MGQIFDGSLSTGGVGSFRPLGYLVVCVVGACCRQGFVFGGVVLEFGKCWVVVSIARGLYGAKRGSRRVWVCVHMFYRAVSACLPLMVAKPSCVYFVLQDAFILFLSVECSVTLAVVLTGAWRGRGALSGGLAETWWGHGGGAGLYWGLGGGR